MSQSFVADASVALAWASEAQSDAGTERLRNAAIAGARVVVPALWAWEVANTLLTLHRRRRFSLEQWRTACFGISEIPVTVDDGAVEAALSAASVLAHAHTLTVYDAAYLELAIRYRLPLATRDRALNKAANKRGVETLL